MSRLVVPVLGLALVACKTDEKKQASEGDPPIGSAKDPAPKDPVAAEPDANDGPDFPAAIEPCPGWTEYKSGSIKVEITGAETFTFEATELTSASGEAIGEHKVYLGWRSPSGNEKMAFSVPCEAGKSEGGLSNLQAGNGVWIAGACTFDVTKNDATGLEGTIDCPALANMQSTDKSKTVKVAGSYSAAR